MTLIRIPRIVGVLVALFCMSGCGGQRRVDTGQIYQWLLENDSEEQLLWNGDVLPANWSHDSFYLLDNEDTSYGYAEFREKKRTIVVYFRDVEIVAARCLFQDEAPFEVWFLWNVKEFNKYIVMSVNSRREALAD